MDKYADLYVTWTLKTLPISTPALPIQGMEYLTSYITDS